MKKLTQIDWSLTVPNYETFQSELIRAICIPTHIPLHAIEFGIGNATTTELFQNTYPAACLTVVDKDTQALEHAYAQFSKNIQDRTYTVHATFEEFATNEMFNVALSTLSFHYLQPEAQINFLKNTQQILHPGGVFVIGNLIKLNDYDFQMATNRSYDAHRNEVQSIEESDKFYQHMYQSEFSFNTIRETIEMFSKAGFSHVDIAWCYRSLCVFRATK